MRLWRNLLMARETMKILRARSYCIDGNVVSHPNVDLKKAILCGGSELSALQDEEKCPVGTASSRIEVSQLDSFDAARAMSNPLVLNFANAHCPGGGFRLGASSQEESLCRRSSLYLSLNSAEASKMYHFNNLHLSPMESNWMVLSPLVCVFRDSNGRLLRNPYLVSVISAPAPNLRGLGFFASRRRVRESIKGRIRIMLTEAYRHQYRELVLGAWGCGAFGNSPEMVAECFRSELVDCGLVGHFDKVVFAIRGNKGERSFAQFSKAFKG